MATGIRILLADDHPVVLARLVDLLRRSEFEVVGTVCDGQAALDAVTALKPDLVVLDISMPVLTGLQAAARLAKRADPPAVVILTIHDDALFVEAARDVGALGYVLKAHLVSDLIPAIHAALAHRPFVSPSLGLRATSGRSSKRPA